MMIGYPPHPPQHFYQKVFYWRNMAALLVAAVIAGFGFALGGAVLDAVLQIIFRWM